MRIRNATGAANALYLGLSDVTNTPTNALAQIAAGGDWEMTSMDGWWASTDDIYLVGTSNAANIAFIACIE